MVRQALEGERAAKMHSEMHADLAPERLVLSGQAQPSSAVGQCMKCGFCTIDCPTFVLLRDERDSPRGRVRFALQILEEGRVPETEAIRRLDRCLSCLGCSTACPFGVDHRHLWDRARAAIEDANARPLGERVQRRLLVRALTSPALFRLALSIAPLGRMLRGVLPTTLARALDLLPAALPVSKRNGRARVFLAAGRRRLRVALLPGCVQQVLSASIDAATVSLLTRHGCEVVIPDGSGCCGALALHLGMPDYARRLARKNVEAWEREAANGLDAVIINVSGCGTTVKDYGRLLGDDPRWSQTAARIESLARDVVELASELTLKPAHRDSKPTVALHLPCSLQHGQGISSTPRRLLEEMEFDVRVASEAHLCCGSAGTYTFFQPDLADQLGKRKAQALAAVSANVIATGNIGCSMHIARFSKLPIVHTVELLDWATGGAQPPALNQVVPR